MPEVKLRFESPLFCICEQTWEVELSYEKQHYYLNENIADEIVHWNFPNLGDWILDGHFNTIVRRKANPIEL